MVLGGSETFRSLALQTNWSYDAILGKGRREHIRVLPGAFHHPLPKAASHIDRPHGFMAFKSAVGKKYQIGSSPSPTEGANVCLATYAYAIYRSSRHKARLRLVRPRS